MIKHFEAVPEIPLGLQPWEAIFMRALKQDMDLLVGANDPNHVAILKGEVTATGVTFQGYTGAFTAQDHFLLAQEVVFLRIALNELLNNLKQ